MGSRMSQPPSVLGTAQGTPWDVYIYGSVTGTQVYCTDFSIEMLTY